MLFEDLDVDNLDLFFQTMVTRQNMWCDRAFKQRVLKVKDDEILTNNKFTNVYRELDRSSQFLISQIIMDETLSDIDVLFKILFYRVFNKPETFIHFKKVYGYNGGVPSLLEYNNSELIDVLKQLRRIPQNPFTNAYYINSTSSSTQGKSRDYRFYNCVIPHIFDNIFIMYDVMLHCSKPKELISEFLKIPAVSNFISHEFYQDLTHIERYTNRKMFKFTQNDFTNVGPGCESGLGFIYPNLKTKQEKLDKLFELRDLANSGVLSEMCFKFLNWDKQKRKYSISLQGEITLHQIEMWLCEFSKYKKMQQNKGRQRMQYTKDLTKDYSFYLY